MRLYLSSSLLFSSTLLSSFFYFVEIFERDQDVDVVGEETCSVGPNAERQHARGTRRQLSRGDPRNR